VEVVRKDIKNLHLGVYPPNGHVRVAVPLRINDETVRLAVISRLGWIRRKQIEFINQNRQSRREMITGESHYFRGRRYRLDVVEYDGPGTIRLKNSSSMELLVRPNMDRDKREEVLNRWYRSMLQEQIPGLIAKWQPRLGVRVEEWHIKKMKTLWGSCNAEAKRIWLNLELAKKSPSCVEYILVHEMIHLLERRHSGAFRTLMDHYMPNWRLYRDELNRAPLAHADWKY